MSDVVSDAEFEKIMNIKERFPTSNESLNLNHRKTLNSILKCSKKSTLKVKSNLTPNFEVPKKKFKEDRENRTPDKRVSFAKSLLSYSNSGEIKGENQEDA